MFSRHHLRIFSLLAIFIAITQANWVNPNARRQDAGGLLNDLSSIFNAGKSSSDSSSSTPAASSQSSQSSTSVPPSTTPPPSSTSPPSSSSTTPPPSRSSSSSSQEDSTSSSSSRADPTIQPPGTTAPPSVVVVTTVIDGSTSSYRSTMTSSSSTSSATNGASLDSSSKSSSSGMSPQTKRTVIGVVVGVGGAIILAGLFIVAWRIWGRKKTEDESDGLMGFRGGSSGGGHEKSGSISTAPSSNPFQTTLDQYHAPNRPVNASSNF